MNYKSRPSQRNLGEFIITKIDLIIKNVIPFFENHPIKGSKHLDFLDFKNAAILIKNKEHLNINSGHGGHSHPTGLDKILNLKKNITTRRGHTP